MLRLECGPSSVMLLTAAGISLNHLGLGDYSARKEKKECIPPPEDRRSHWGRGGKKEYPVGGPGSGRVRKAKEGNCFKKEGDN